MPILVHLADERVAASIRKNGIKIGEYRQGIFCMPVLQNFYVSHQWLRELKRSGVKTYIGIYFKIDDETLVYAGKYNQEHKHIPLGQAIKEIMELEDPLGYELIIPRKIEAKEIEKIRALPQKIGWRYFPSSHSIKPGCRCRMCIPSGTIKGRKLRDKIEPPEKQMSYFEALTRLKTEENEDKIETLLWTIMDNRKRRSDPNDLVFLFEKKSHTINRRLASVLRAFEHKNTKAILLTLLESADNDTRNIAAYGLLFLYAEEMEQFLIEKNDEAINEAIEEWKDC